MPEDKSRRMNAMMWAYLFFAAKKLPVKDRECLCWLYLLDWASLGGQPNEMIGVRNA